MMSDRIAQTLEKSQFAPNSQSIMPHMQALSQLPNQVSTTGGQHESMEQRQRQRVMSFSEASDTDSNISLVSYQKELAPNNL